MSVTIDQPIRRQDPDRAGYPVAASTTLYGGTLVFLNLNGYADDDTANGANKFGGVTVKRYDNSSGANGDIKAEVWHKGIFVLEGSGFSQADISKAVYATDNYTITTSPTENSVFIGRVVELVSSTRVAVEIKTSHNNFLVLSETFSHSDFTDNTDTTGYVDFANYLPAGAVVQAFQAVTSTGFTGDTSATIQVGVDGDLDRFSAVTNGSVFAAGTIGSQPADNSSALIESLTTPRVTVTSNSDFTSVSAGSVRVDILYTVIP